MTFRRHNSALEQPAGSHALAAAGQLSVSSTARAYLDSQYGGSPMNRRIVLRLAVKSHDISRT